MIKLEYETTPQTIIKYIFKLVENSDDIFWAQEVNGEVFTYLSPAVEQVMGTQRENIYKNMELWIDYVVPPDREAYRVFHENIRQQPIKHQHYELEYRIQSKKGSIFYLREIVIPIFSHNGQLVGFAGLAKNVTTVKLTSMHLEKSAQYFQLFAERMKAVFWVREYATNKQLYISPGYEVVWGRTRESLYADPKGWLQTVHPEDRESLMGAIHVRQASEKEDLSVYHESRFRIIMPDASLRYIKDTCFPIKDDENNIVVFAGISEDITKDMEYENALREAKEKAEFANKTKSDFLAMISHELRTPLNAILGMSQIIKTKNITDEVASCVDAISDAGNSLLSLVNDVLDFARLEVGKLNFVNQAFNLPELFQRAIKSLQYMADAKGLSLSLTVQPGINGRVMGDANRVQQVLSNLLTNAIKFTEKGGITVDLKAAPLNNEKACFDVVVKDTGIGIPAEKLDTIFEKFSQVDSIYQRKHAGIGLGLSITKELVSAMGGDIQVSSELGHGSTFHFTLCLPLQTVAEMEAVAWRDALIYSSQRPQYNLRLLLVEDNLVNQRIARMMFEDFGCRVDILNNGQEVMARLAELPTYDLIFMDVGLPDMSGFEITTRLRQEESLRSIPIIAMTAHVLPEDRKQAADAGMDKVVAKPITYEEIRLVLESHAS